MDSVLDSLFLWIGHFGGIIDAIHHHQSKNNQCKFFISVPKEKDKCYILR